MNGLVKGRQKAYNIITTVLIYCLAVMPMAGPAGWCAPATGAQKAALSKAEKESLVQQGVDQYNQGGYDQARKNLEQARADFPENYAAPYYLGLIYLKQGDRTAAITQWRQYVQMDPGSENALRIRKNLTILLLEEARESARRAVADEASLLSTPAADNTLAISPFKNMGSENIQPLGKGMAALLIHDLALVPGLTVVERVRLQALLREMKLGSSELVTPASAPKVGKLLKAKHVSSGSLADLEAEDLQIASAVVNANQLSDVDTQEAKGELKKFYALEKEIACQIVEDLGKKCDDAPPAFHRIHTKSLAALLFFAAGLDYMDQEEYDQARESFQKALDKDPSFELAEQALLDTPVPGMQYLAETGGTTTGVGTTDQMIAMASTHGVSAKMAGMAVASKTKTATGDTGGVGIVPVAGIVGGAAVAAGVALAAGGGSGSDGGSSGGGTPGGGGTTPTSQCNERQVAGGDAADQRNIELGQSSGSFNFFFETFSIKDRIIVSYEGNPLFDTQCVGDSNTVPLSFSGTATQIRVEVIPNCDGNTSGTAWNYTASCP